MRAGTPGRRSEIRDRPPVLGRSYHRIMPRRPRQHILEDESRVALRQRLNRVGWRFEDFDIDYGVDGLVEIFVDEQSTGLTFNVQLKATDTPSEPLNVRFPRETFEYYKRLEPPVLVVRYHAASDTLYTRWVHSFDPYFGGTTEKSVTVRFGESDRWDDTTPERLRAELHANRQFKAPEVALPITFYIDWAESVFKGWDVSRHLIDLRRAAAPLSRILQFRRGPAPAGAASVTIRPDELVVDFGGIKSFSVHDLDEIADLAPSTFSYDVLTAIACGLGVLGQPNLGSRVTEVAVDHASLVKVPEITFQLAALMGRAHRLSESLRAAETLRQRAVAKGNDDLSAAALVLSLAGLGQSAPSESVRAEVRAFHDRLLEDAAAEGSREAGSAHYNLANHLFHAAGDPREAFRHYRLAARNDPSYGDRDYFCQEVGGCLFEAERYTLAAKFYRRAIEISGDEGIRARLADAILAGGQFGEAAEEFARYINASEEPEPEWTLKLWILDLIRAEVGDRQSRNPKAAADAQDLALASPDDDVRESGLRAALGSDALAGNAWFNLGVLYWKQGRLDESVGAFLVAAGLLRYDVEAWSNVIPFAWMWDRQHDDPMLAGLSASKLFEAAWNLNGYAITQAVAEGFAKLTDADIRTEALEWLEREEACQRPRGAAFTLPLPPAWTRRHVRVRILGRLSRLDEDSRGSSLKAPPALDQVLRCQRPQPSSCCAGELNGGALSPPGLVGGHVMNLLNRAGERYRSSP